MYVLLPSVREKHAIADWFEVNLKINKSINIQFYNNLKIHKLNYAEDPLATSASGLSTVSINKINYSKVDSTVKSIYASTVSRLT